MNNEAVAAISNGRTICLSFPTEIEKARCAVPAEGRERIASRVAVEKFRWTPYGEDGRVSSRDGGEER